MDNITYMKNEYFSNDIVMSELIRSMSQSGEVKLSSSEVKELMHWAGDDEYMDMDEYVTELRC